MPHGRIIKTSSLSGQSKDKVPHLPGAVNPDHSRKVREIVLTMQPSQVLIIAELSPDPAQPGPAPAQPSQAKLGAEIALDSGWVGLVGSVYGIVKNVIPPTTGRDSHCFLHSRDKLTHHSGFALVMGQFVPRVKKTMTVPTCGGWYIPNPNDMRRKG